MAKCGIDEAGRGPLIGPMVMAVVCGNSSDLKHIGVADSKKLSPKRRESIYKELSGFMQNHIIISPAEIDSYVRDKKLNVMEEHYALQLISLLPADSVIYVDSFDVDESRLESKLQSASGREIICRHHADDIYPQVSAASIVAKVIRDSEIEKLHDKFGDFGSGYPSDPRTVHFVENAIKDHVNIDSIVRHEWKTYKNMFNSKLRY
ncbi:ribonuclease HII [Ferroplasma sp.]|uniref:ribonuclease HII n=1 Tax=Ferroplasma sp. TaxID=2591003 RepID=UPI00260DD9B0|nr:ribonuclease HII [Ferroplasma sp.]MCL4453951.1 ribonuclease HII [Candidatus Thermoplasmatota archaeon]